MINELKDDDEYVNYLLRFDETSVILKSHLNLEQMVDEAIKKKFIKPQQILKWNFINKVHLLYASGILNDKNFEGFKGFNELRNKFSHNYKYELTKKDISFLEKIEPSKEIKIPTNLENIEKLKIITQIIKTSATLRSRLLFGYVKREELIEEIIKNKTN